MASADRRLAVVLALVAVAAAAVYLHRPAVEAPGPPRLYGLPWTLAGWQGADGAPERVLPVDPAELARVRRTYRRSGQTAWIAVAAFTRQDVPKRRASINLIYPRRHTASIEQLTLPLSLNGSPGSTATLPAVVVRSEDQRFVVVYWRQLGSRVHGSDYGYRLALMRSSLLSGKADMILVRIAVPLPPSGGMDEALSAVAGLAPAVHAGLAELGGH